jgi:hypothetical protein
MPISISWHRLSAHPSNSNMVDRKAAGDVFKSCADSSLRFGLVAGAIKQMGLSPSDDANLMI